MSERVPATALAAALEQDERLASAFGHAAGAALEPDAPPAARAYVAACLQARFAKLARSWPEVPELLLEATLHLMLLDADRFVEDESFREAAAAFLAAEVAPPEHAGLRDRLLFEWNQVRGVDFHLSEALEHAWGAVPRRALERERRVVPGAWPTEDGISPIEATIFSLNLVYTDPAEARHFLQAVVAAHPQRRILVLADLPLRQALGGTLPEVVWLETYGRGYSAWPRDPFTVLRRSDGGLAFLVRPRPQRGREEDNWMAPELVQTLPPELDTRWKHVTWARAPVPFHNGHLLFTPEAVWVSLHSLERRVLERLGLERVPVESFGSVEGRRRYLEAVGAVAREYASLLGRPVRFVHPLPKPDEGELLVQLGGGAGYDLDSIVTLLPRPGTAPAALVADLDEAHPLLAAPGEEWASFARAFGFDQTGAALRDATRRLQDSRRAVRLDAFLELVAAELERQGFEVERLPLLLVPTQGHPDRPSLGDPFFLLTWNNVVAERRGKTQVADGFSSLLPAGDRIARERFARLGFQLRLLPPLVRSILRQGGYRCASNQVRIPVRVRAGGPPASR